MYVYKEQMLHMLTFHVLKIFTEEKRALAVQPLALTYMPN